MGSLTLRIHPIGPDENPDWYIASVTLPISICNDGGRTGQVLGMRMRLHYPRLAISANREFLHAAFRIDPLKMFEAGRDRKKMLELALLVHWHPFAVLPRATVGDTIAFETRWDKRLNQPMLEFTLQIFTSSRRKWRDVAKWSMQWNDWWWHELTEGSSALSVPPQGSPPLVEDIVLANLQELVRKHANDDD